MRLANSIYAPNSERCVGDDIGGRLTQRRTDLWTCLQWSFAGRARYPRPTVDQLEAVGILSQKGLLCKCRRTTRLLSSTYLTLVYLSAWLLRTRS
jgi:hypothetical protein